MNKKIISLAKALSKLGFKKEASELEISANDSTGKVEFSGILKLMPANPPTDLQELLSNSSEELGLKPIPADKLHITLLNQAVLKPFAKELKGKSFPEYGGPITYGGVYLVDREEEGRKSIFVVINERDDISSYISKALEEMGIPAKPEEGRIYHISLANKTGNPHDSVGHSEAKPIKLEDCTPVEY